MLSCGASEVVVGLETLEAFADLCRHRRGGRPSRVVFSLDLQAGQSGASSGHAGCEGPGPDALSLAGRPSRPASPPSCCWTWGESERDAEWISGCWIPCGDVPDIRLLAGGGVLTRRDLERMRDAGCDGALIASAIHSGRVTAARSLRLGLSAH